MRIESGSMGLTSLFSDDLLTNHQFDERGDKPVDEKLLEMILNAPELLPQQRFIQLPYGQWEMVSESELCAIAYQIYHKSLVFPCVKGFEYLSGMPFLELPFSVQAQLMRAEMQYASLHFSALAEEKERYKLLSSL